MTEVLHNPKIKPVHLARDRLPSAIQRQTISWWLRFAVGAIRVHRVNTVAAEFEKNSRPERVELDEAFVLVA